MDTTTGIWTLDEAKRRHRYDERLAAAIYNMFKPMAVADIGCGVGTYCSFFKTAGWDTVHGYEGTQDIKSIATYDDIMFIDLTKKRPIGIEYDLVICLEVGEHIPAGFEQTFMDNIAAFSSKDLVLSWAIPKQGGLGHFNEKTNDEIINAFNTRGFNFDRERTNLLREASTLKWFKNTVMVFNRG